MQHRLSGGAGLVAKSRILFSVFSVKHCLGREDKQIVTVKPEVDYSSHNKVVLKESK